MRCRIRYVTRQPNDRGGASRKERLVEVEGRRLRLGRSPTNDVPLNDLRVSYHHADIVVRDTDVVIEAVGGSSLLVEGVAKARGLLTPDAEIEVGPYRIALVTPSPTGDADLTLDIELVTPPPPETIATLAPPSGLRLAGAAALGKRGLSWLLFLLALAVGLGLPLAAYLGRQPAPAPGRGPASPGSPTVLAGLDRVWNPGELSPSHKFLLHRCESCHERAFVKVRSEACGSCHAGARHHFDTERFRFADFAPTRCSGCHTEHRGDAGNIPVHQSLCAGCHADLGRHPGKTPLLDAADFGSAHPQFRPSVTADPATGRVERATLGAPDFPKERSGLKFSHRIHLARTCERPPPGDAKAAAAWPEEKTDACLVLQDVQRLMKKAALDCGDCHRPDPSGVDMRPATMRTDCSMCHTLQFDPSAPERTLPHGQPDEVIAVVQDYYAARQASGKPVVEPVPLALQRKVGAGAARQSPPGAAPEAGREPRRGATDVAKQRLDTIFGQALCGECHEVVPPAESAKRKWEVRPVRVAEVWMPKARFTHAAHATSPCADCHDAHPSRSSADVLMPGVATCRRCHGGEAALALVPSTCADCHAYHRGELGPMLTPPSRPQQAETRSSRSVDGAETR